MFLSIYKSKKHFSTFDKTKVQILKVYHYFSFEQRRIKTLINLKGSFICSQPFLPYSSQPTTHSYQIFPNPPTNFTKYFPTHQPLLPNISQPTNHVLPNISQPYNHFYKILPNKPITFTKVFPTH